MNDAHVIAADELERLAAAIFTRHGVAAPNAALWAKVLVWADLRGVGSHGVMRIPRYLELIGKGAINPVPQMQLSGAAALCRLDADLAPGPVAMQRAMAEAIERARRFGVGWCAVRNLTHAGAIGYFALQAAEAGMAGITMSASNTPMMAYHGAAQASLSSNPLAIAVPAGRRAPLLLDMSTSSVAMGKILAAKAAGQPIPADWGVDAGGRPTTNPALVAALLPAAGAKGSGLSLMIECLASLAVGNPLLGHPVGAGPRMNATCLAVDLAALEQGTEWETLADELADYIAVLPPADPKHPVLLPGERGNQEATRRESEGITLPGAVWWSLLEVIA